MAAFDGGTDHSRTFLCSQPLEVEISSGQANGIFSFKSSSSSSSGSFPATSSFHLLHLCSLRFLLLMVSHLWACVRGADQIRSSENEIPKDSVYHTMLNVTFALSLCLSCNISTECKCRFRHQTCTDTHTHTHTTSRLKCI